MFLCFFFLVSLPLSALDKNAVAATVNGTKITFGRLDQTYKQSLLVVGTEAVTKEKVLYDLINRELGIAKARKARLHDNPTVKEKMEDVMYHAQISRDLEPEFKKIKVTDRDVQRYYSQHPEYRTAHILFRMRTTPSRPEKEEAMKKALEVYDELKENPEKFAELANKYTQTASAPNGGDVGFQPAVKYAPAYFKAIKGKKAGHITPPVRTRFGLHIIKVLARRDYDNINKEFYKKIIYDQRRDKAMDDYFKKIRSTASISINKEALKE